MTSRFVFVLLFLYFIFYGEPDIFDYARDAVIEILRAFK